jgi:hypothetical protein
LANSILPVSLLVIPIGPKPLTQIFIFNGFPLMLVFLEMRQLMVLLRINVVRLLTLSNPTLRSPLPPYALSSDNMKLPFFTIYSSIRYTDILVLDMALLVSNDPVFNNAVPFLAPYNACTPVGELAKLIHAANTPVIWDIWPLTSRAVSVLLQTSHQCIYCLLAPAHSRIAATMASRLIPYVQTLLKTSY